MERCTVKRGFLHLRECGEPAHFRCSVCHRPTCDDHLIGTGIEGVCVECHARQHPPEALDDAVAVDASNASRWRHRYRDHYYSETDYRPTAVAGAATAGYYTGTYGADDRAAFEQQATDGGEPWDDDGPGFADS